MYWLHLGLKQHSQQSGGSPSSRATSPLLAGSTPSLSPAGFQRTHWGSDTCAQSCWVYEEDTHVLWSSEKVFRSHFSPQSPLQPLLPSEITSMSALTGACTRLSGSWDASSLCLYPQSGNRANRHMQGCHVEPLLVQGTGQEDTSDKGGISAPFGAKGTNVSLAQPYQDTCLSFWIGRAWYSLQ